MSHLWKKEKGVGREVGKKGIEKERKGEGIKKDQRQGKKEF